MKVTELLETQVPELFYMLSLRDAENDDEVDAVKILLNALYSGAPGEQSLTSHNELLRTGKGRVTFQQIDRRDISEHQLRVKASRKPPIIPNAPINKDHQTLLGTTTSNISDVYHRHLRIRYNHKPFQM